MITKTRRITAGVAAVAATAGIGFACAGAAHAGTMPVTRPGGFLASLSSRTRNHRRS